MLRIRLSDLAPETLYTQTVSQPWGTMVLGVDEKNTIRFFEFLKGRTSAEILAVWQNRWPKTRFEKTKHNGPLPTTVTLSGTEFQRAVWQTIATIPFGKLMSYGDIALKIGRPRAVRAVGSACGANPVPIFIPCHRVIAGDGSLGGFGGGIDIKKQILRTEGFSFP